VARVLIVDDEAGIRFALKRWFERQEWFVVEAEDGEAASALIDATASGESFDLVVCDLHLPLLSGSAVLERLRRDGAPIADRFILTTGDSVTDAGPDTVLSSHPWVLQKPFDLVTLKAMVTRVLA